jgi:hypothetical protein
MKTYYTARGSKAFLDETKKTIVNTNGIVMVRNATPERINSLVSSGSLAPAYPVTIK